MSTPFQPRDLLQELDDAGIRFVLVGGLAVAAWGYVRGTDDLDIVPDPDPDNLSNLAEVLERLDGRVVTRDGLLTADAIRVFLRAGDKTLVQTTMGEVDVLQGLPAIPTYQELSANSESARIEGVEVAVCSLADLRAMKRAADRHRDRDDLEGLQIAHPDE